MQILVIKSIKYTNHCYFLLFLTHVRTHTHTQWLLYLAHLHYLLQFKYNSHKYLYELYDVQHVIISFFHRLPTTCRLLIAGKSQRPCDNKPCHNLEPTLYHCKVVDSQSL